METQTQSPSIPYWDKKPTPLPRVKRINLRMIVFLVFISMPFVFVASIFVKGALNHGIEQGKDLAIVDLKALGNFPFDKDTGTDESIPPIYRALDGKRVQLKGFMGPTNSASPTVDAFQFVYNVQICCFGGPPKVQERVYAFCPPGQRIPYIPDFMKLTGILHVKVQREGGMVQSVYTMDVESAEPG